MSRSIDPDLADFEVWFLTGSQALYGEDTLRQVAEQSQTIARMLDEAGDIPVRVVWKPVLTDSASIRRAAIEANASDTTHRRHRLDAHVQPGEDVDHRPGRCCASRCCTCTRRPTSNCPGRTSTWTS